MHQETLALHAGFSLDPATRAVAVPIYQTVAYGLGSSEHAAALFKLEVDGQRCSRISNPTNAVLEARVAALECGKDALCVASGQAALHHAVSNALAPGRNMAPVTQLYGATHAMSSHVLPDLGIQVQSAKSDSPDDIGRLTDHGAHAVFRESVGNPAGYIADTEAIATVAHRNGLPFIMDDIVATPPLRLMEFGADVVVQSLTEFMGGHGTTLGGGKIEPIPSCAPLARVANLWPHVDAAWGGALIASSRFRGVLAGIGSTDPVTIDAHRWLAATMGCVMFLTSRPMVPSAAYHAPQEAASVMPSNDAQQAPYAASMPWSRRFLGLWLFLILVATGLGEIADHVKRAAALMDLLKSHLAAGGRRIVNTPRWPCPAPSRRQAVPGTHSIANEIVASGKAWFTMRHSKGREVVRFCLTNRVTPERDVTSLAELLLDHAPTNDSKGLGQYRG